MTRLGHVEQFSVPSYFFSELGFLFCGTCKHPPSYQPECLNKLEVATYCPVSTVGVVRTYGMAIG